MFRYVIIGKIIIDRIRLADGSYAQNLLGGGGPQAALGARIWSSSVGFAGVSGTDMEPHHIAHLRSLGFDLQGWTQYPDIPTPHTLMEYDETEQRATGGIQTSRRDWQRLFEQPVPLPPDYRQPKIVHWQTGYMDDEPTARTILQMREQGVLFSMEPVLLDVGWWKDSQPMFLNLFRQVDIVTPDFPAAAALAKKDGPLEVMKHWMTLGPRVVALRDGARGSYVWDREEDVVWHIPIVPVTLADPTGAGNAYGGGLVAGWGETADARKAGCCGSISASYLVRSVGIPAFSPEMEAEAHGLLPRLLENVTRL